MARSRRECPLDGDADRTSLTRAAVAGTACVDTQMEKVGTALPSTTCVEICGLHGSVITCSVAAVDAASVTVNCLSGCVTGRRPHG
jgi:hypothetical protein